MFFDFRNTKTQQQPPQEPINTNDDEQLITDFSGHEDEQLITDINGVVDEQLIPDTNGVVDEQLITDINGAVDEQLIPDTNGAVDEQLIPNVGSYEDEQLILDANGAVYEQPIQDINNIVDEQPIQDINNGSNGISHTQNPPPDSTNHFSDSDANTPPPPPSLNGSSACMKPQISTPPPPPDDDDDAILPPDHPCYAGMEELLRESMYNKAMDSRKELADALNTLDNSTEYNLLEEASEMLRDSYKDCRELAKSRLTKVYDSDVIEKELMKAKKTPREKAERLLRVQEDDLASMSLEEIILYGAKCKKAKVRLDKALAVRVSAKHKDWKLVVKLFPPARELVPVDGHEEWRFEEPCVMYASPAFPLVEGDAPENLCPNYICCKHIEKKGGSDKKHEKKYVHVCKYGSLCRDRNNAEHLKMYVHLDKPICGDKSCTDVSPEHRSEYTHAGEWDYLIRCWDNGCKNTNTNHTKKYTHEQECFPSIK